MEFTLEHTDSEYVSKKTPCGKPGTVHDVSVSAVATQLTSDRSPPTLRVRQLSLRESTRIRKSADWLENIVLVSSETVVQ